MGNRMLTKIRSRKFDTMTGRTLSLSARLISPVVILASGIAMLAGYTFIAFSRILAEFFNIPVKNNRVTFRASRSHR